MERSSSARRCLAACVASAIACAIAGADAETDKAEKVLTARHDTERFEIRFRPGSRAAASVDRVAVVAERDAARIFSLLDMKAEGKLRLFLYDDVAELAAITKTGGNAGYSSGNASHVPHDNDQTRFHELVHVIAYRLPKSGSEPRNLFFAEGLANALLEFVDGVPVHAVAAFEKRRGALPPLGEMTAAKDFYAWLGKHPGLDAYDIAGSYFRFLIDTHGAGKVKQYYTGQPPQEAFGVPEEQLEKDWHEHLGRFVLRPEVETLLRRRRGEAAKFSDFEVDTDKRLPAELLGKPKDWKSLVNEELQGDPRSDWKLDGKSIRATWSAKDWSVVTLGKKRYKDCAVRAKVKLEAGCGAVQIRLGPRCEGMVVGNGTFIYCDGKPRAQNVEESLAGRQELDLLLERRGTTVAVWLDGRKVLEGKADFEEAPVGLGIVGGSAVFEDVRVRELK